MSYERTDASPRLIVISVALVVFGVAGSLVAAASFYGARSDDRSASHAPKRQTSFTGGPLVQTSIARDWAESEAASKRLNEYAWVDRNAGVARIPIERALAWIAVHGGDAAVNTAPASRVLKDESRP